MTNLGVADRIVRAVIGAAIVAYCLPRGIDSALWQWVGIAGAFALVTAAAGFCPAYRGLGLSSAAIAPTKES